MTANYQKEPPLSKITPTLQNPAKYIWAVTKATKDNKNKELMSRPYITLNPVRI